MSAWTDWTIDELKAFRKKLGAAIATGATRVRFADRDVTYRDLAEMRLTASMIDNELTLRAGGNPLRRLRVESRKGFA